MKNKKTLVAALLASTIILTGCTSYLKDDKNVIVKNPKTGQNVVENILCTIESDSALEIYKENNLDISKLPNCKDYSLKTGKYEGVWNTLFVKPLAWLILKIGYLVKNFGLAIVIITALIRLVLMPFTKKAAMQSENLKKVQPELNRIEKKYKNKTDQESMMQKSQETLALYKKYDINPASGCLFSFIQLPLFMAFYEALYRLPAVFEGKFLFFDLGITPLTAFSQGRWYYIIIVLLVFLVTFYSFKLNMGASMSSEQAQQMKMMRNVTLVLIGITSFSVSVAIAIYWIVNSGFTVVQNLLVKRSSEKC